ncbi:MAG: 3,4-dihydroxyphenylacetate 2,3-dioxygenase [Caldilineaceae bacterium]
MPIRHPIKNPSFNIIRMSHVELGVANLERARHFYVNTLGLIETEQVDNSLYLRGLEERNHHSFVLTQMAEPVALRLGFKVASEADLDRIEQHFASLGLPTQWVDQYAQGPTLQTRDPLGTPLEFYYAMDQVKRRLQSYGDYCGCRPMRIDHFNCFTPDVQASHDFYANELGFRTTEYTETESTELGDDRDPPELWAVWMHRKGNVHDLALTNGIGPRLHHTAIWAPTAMDIIHLCDLMATTGYLAHLERGPGRHGISNAFFLYVRDPDGHRIEIYTSDYLTVDPDFAPIRWGLRDAQRQTLWGHAAPKSWFEEGTRFAGVATCEPKLTAQPIVAN